MPPYSSFRIYFGTLIPAQSKVSAWIYAIHPVRASLGKGAEHDHHMSRHPYIGLELEGSANQINELRVFGPLFLAVELHVKNQEIQIHPCDLSYATSWHLPAPNLLSKELLHIERLFVFKHKVYGAAQFVGEDPQGFALVVFSFVFCHVIFGPA